MKSVFITALDARLNNSPREIVVHDEAREIESEILKSVKLGFYEASVCNGTIMTNSNTAPIDVWTIDPTTSQLYIPNHGLFSGEAVTVNSTVSLPSPLISTAYYYVIYVDPNYIKLATSYANAISRQPIGIAVSSGVNTISVTNGGSGYLFSPAIDFVGGNPTTSAIAIATLSTWGNVLALSNSTSGSNYTDQPTASIVSVGSGATAGTVTYQAVGVSIASGGSTYQVGQILSVIGGIGTATSVIVTDVDVNGAVLTVSLNNPGDYTILPPLTGVPTAVLPAGGTGATLTVTMGILAIAVSAIGVGYLQQPVVTITDPSGIGAVVTAIVQGGGVSSFVVSNPGHGYVSVSTVTISSGSGATATPVLQPVAAANVILTYNGGNTYTSAPSVTINAVGGGATAATVYMTVVCANIAFTGSGYKVNDTLLVAGGTIVSNAYIRVLSTDLYGAIISYSLQSGGSYTQLPVLAYNLAIGGSGTGASFNLSVGVLSITLGAGGSGYSVPPDITIDPPGVVGGITAVYRAVISSGNVSSFNAITIGTEYINVPNVSITNGSGATAIATLSPTTVSNINVNVDGTGYTFANVTVVGGGASIAATGNAVISGGNITAITLLTPGVGYTSIPSISIIGNGNGAIATAILSPTSIASVALINAGNLYNYPPAVSIAGNATAVTTLAATGVDYLFVTNRGITYTSTPTVFINPGTNQSGTPTSPIITVSLGYSVVSIQITNSGIGYFSIPDIVIAAPYDPNGTGATATATIGIGNGTFALIPYYESQDYFKAWKGQQLSNPQLLRPYKERMQSIIDYFTNLGYTINRVTNPNTNNTLTWNVCW